MNIMVLKYKSTEGLTFNWKIAEHSISHTLALCHQGSGNNTGLYLKELQHIDSLRSSTQENLGPKGKIKKDASEILKPLKPVTRILAQPLAIKIYQ